MAFQTRPPVAQQPESELLIEREKCIFLQEVAQILARRYGPEGWKIPTRGLPNFVVKIGAMFDPQMKRTKPMLDCEMRLDNSRVRKVLNWQTYSNEDMIIAMADSMIELGVVTKG